MSFCMVVYQAQIRFAHHTSRYFTMHDYEDGFRLLRTGAISTVSLISDMAQFCDLFVDNGQRVMDRAKQAVRLLIER